MILSLVRLSEGATATPYLRVVRYGFRAIGNLYLVALRVAAHQLVSNAIDLGRLLGAVHSVVVLLILFPEHSSHHFVLLFAQKRILVRRHLFLQRPLGVLLQDVLVEVFGQFVSVDSAVLTIRCSCIC